MNLQMAGVAKSSDYPSLIKVKYQDILLCYSNFYAEFLILLYMVQVYHEVMTGCFGLESLWSKSPDVLTRSNPTAAPPLGSLPSTSGGSHPTLRHTTDTSSIGAVDSTTRNSVSTSGPQQWSWDSSHYLDGIRCSNIDTQQAIQRHVHALYRHLITSLLMQQQPEKGQT